MKSKAIISICDYTGIFVEQWAKDGYECFLFDIQHECRSDGNIHYIGGGLEKNLGLISRLMNTYKIKFVACFPPCTDTAVSGAAHFEAKKKKDALFQARAVTFFQLCYNIAKATGAPFFVENPVSVVSSYFRKPDYTFHPWEYGGYLQEDDVNPLSTLIPGRDAYPKKTCLWTGNGFIMPEKKPVKEPNGYSPQYAKLGGKSLKTKNLRSATPRGFSVACYLLSRDSHPDF